MWWEMIPRWPIGMLAHYASLRRRTQRLLVLGLAGALAITLLIGVAASVITGAFAAPTNLVPPGATCAQLARADQTATNGPTWGETILPGHGAPGGWFGVDVCSNGISSATVGGSNISCDRVPSKWARTGCAPGNPTDDGYGWSFQCVELIIRFSAWAYGDSPGSWIGNAPDLWLPGNHPSDYVMYPNGSTHAPVPGDILVWGSLDANGNPWPAGPDGQHGGHIGIVAAVRDGMVITAEQNVKWGTVDHPTDTLALSDVGGHWILSGSAIPATTTPTYRWLRTMGHARATYGWLHSIKNTGVFPSPSAGNVRSTPGATKTPTGQNPGGLPSLAPAVVVAGNGALTDLTWASSSSLLASSSSPVSSGSGQANAQATLRNLGSPPNTQLRPNQSAATVSMTNGVRYTYVLGADGKLYAAQTAPSTLGVFWAALGAPGGVHLVGSASASLIATGVVVAALGSDGQLWLRRGAPDTLGAWEALGKPANTALASGFTVAGAPGEGTPLLLAIGANGRLYERLWQDAVYNSDGSVAIPAGWSAWTPIGVPASVGGAHGAPVFTGALLAAPETPSAANFLGSWPDTSLDLFALAKDGSLWRLRSTTILRPWQISVFAAPTSATRFTSLLGAVAVAVAAPVSSAAPAPLAATPLPSALHVYINTPQGVFVLAIPPTSAQGKATGKPQWAQLAALPQSASQAAGVALPLASGLSALVIANGAQVLVGGVSSATAIVLPNGASSQGASTTPTPTPDANGNTSMPWLSLGEVMAPLSFADRFTGKTLDAHWTLTDPTAQITASSQGIHLQPSAPTYENGQATGQQALAALLQRARAGDGALSVQVTPGTTGAAGLILYLDQTDWATLLTDRAGVVTFCAMVWGQAHPCATKTVTPAESGALWLKLTRKGVNYLAAASADDTHWTSVASWAPVWPGVAKQHSGATHSTNTTPVSQVAGSPNGSIAPLAFTCWGVVAVGQDNGGAGALFTNFAYTQR